MYVAAGRAAAVLDETWLVLLSVIRATASRPNSRDRGQALIESIMSERVGGRVRGHHRDGKDRCGVTDGIPGDATGG
jgi:hypothetical protein